MDLIHDPTRGEVEEREDMKVEHLRLLLDMVSVYVYTGSIRVGI